MDLKIFTISKGKITHYHTHINSYSLLFVSFLTLLLKIALNFKTFNHMNIEK